MRVVICGTGGMCELIPSSSTANFFNFSEELVAYSWITKRESKNHLRKKSQHLLYQSKMSRGTLQKLIKFNLTVKYIKGQNKIKVVS